MRCDNCECEHPERDAWPNPKHVFRIIKRGQPLTDKNFCALQCMEVHLKTLEEEWHMVGERWVTDHIETVHIVSLADDELYSSRIKHQG